MSFVQKEMDRRWVVPSGKIVGMEKDTKWSAQDSIFLTVQIGFAGTACVLWFCLPAPGWAVAILSVAAAAMSLQSDMRPWQKALWMVLLGFLLVIELQAISKDRAEAIAKGLNDRADADAKALSDRKVQDLLFKGVRDAQDEDFKATANRLKKAISGIDSTLQTANATLEQTRPFAAIGLAHFGFSGNPPSTIEANVPYTFNYSYINVGSETASDIDVLPRIYIAGIAEDKGIQLEYGRQVDQLWRAGAAHNTGSVIAPGRSSFGTFTGSFSNYDIKELMHPKGALYLFIRFEYSDSTGRWRTDSCGSLMHDSPTHIDFSSVRTCEAFEDFRSPVKQR